MSDERIQCYFDGTGFVPATPFQASLARKRFAEGEVVTLGIDHPRSVKSHNHQFAELVDLWATLPESLADMPYARSKETLRKHALIETGQCDVTTIVAGSKAAAERMVPALNQLATAAHGYAVLRVSGPVIQVLTPHSQSTRAMDGKAWQESKTKVLDWIHALIAGAKP